LVFAGALFGAVVTSWILELGQGADYGQYWQGRYTMPFAVGLPLLVAWRPPGDWLVDRLLTQLGVAGWVILNVGFIASQRRWGVGINGTWYPWRWDDWGPPVAPLILLLVHGVATAWIVACATAIPTSRTAD
jgi:hypothetical protein